MHLIWQDVRYAFRSLRKKPGLSAVIVLSLALGIGANSAIFSVVDALLLRPLPFPQPERLAAIWLHSPGIGIFRDWPSPGQYIDIRNENHSFEEMSISRLTSFVLTGLDQPRLVAGMRTSSSLFRLLGARPMLGRLLLPEDDVPGKTLVAVLSHGIWRRLFSSDPQIVGKSITLNGNQVIVAGVLPADFALNTEVMPSEGPADKLEVFLPLPLAADAVNRRGDENYNLMARLKPGVSVEQAQADIDIIASRIRTKDKRDSTFGMTVVGLLDQVVGDVRRTLLILLGSVALVLLIACANVANLLLTRAAGRQREIAVRTALGAGWQRLVRQLLTESILLGLMGGVGGVLIAQVGLYLVRAFNPGNIPRLDDIKLNAEVLVFTFGVSLVTGILFGLAPAWSAIKTDLNAALKSGGRSGQDTGGLSVGRHHLRGLLVVSELALSLMLLIGAGLLIRSFYQIESVPPGFATDHIISMRLAINGPKYRDDHAVVQFYQDIDSRISHLPGVKSEGFVSALPLTGEVGWGGINVEGYTPEPGHELQVDIRIASPDYFRTMDIPLVKGRFFGDLDTKDGQQVAIIDEKFAQRFWPRESPIGKHIWFDVKKPVTIAGVVGAVKQYGLDSGSKIAVYFPHTQASSGGMYLVARTASDPEGAVSGIVNRIHDADRNAVVYDIRTMQDRLYASLARQRFASALLGAFAIFALILAAVGVYGVMSYLVAQSTHDIGIRVALGAQRGDILGLVIGQGLQLAGIGIGAGLIGSLAFSRVMASLLFGVNALDLVTFASVALILAMVAAIATFIPASRATHVDPMVALRQD